MGQDSIDKVLQGRKQTAPEPAPTTPTEDGDKFYSVLVGEGVIEHFLELKFRDGIRACFPYDELSWFNYHPESGFLDLEFGGFVVSLKGRGFGDALFNYLRQKRVAWVKEADVEMQDNPSNKVFIEKIRIKLPEGGGEEETEGGAGEQPPGE